MTVKAPNLLSPVDVRELELEVSLFASLTNTTPRVWRGTVGTLFQRGHRATSLKGGPGFCLARFKPGTTRANVNVEHVNALAYDYDDITDEQFSQITQRLHRMAHVVYSTFRHGTCPGLCRIRVIIFLSSPLLPDEYRVVRRAVAALIGVTDDPKARAESNFLYPPLCQPHASDKALLKFHDGSLLDVESAKQCSPHYSPRQTTKGAHRLIKDTGSVEDLHLLANYCAATRHLLNTFSDDAEPEHDVRLAIAQLGIALGLTDDQLVALFAKCTDFDEQITRKHLEPLRSGHKRPACLNFSEITGACSGQCDRSKAAKTKSPLGIMAWHHITNSESK